MKLFLLNLRSQGDWQELQTGDLWMLLCSHHKVSLVYLYSPFAYSFHWSQKVGTVKWTNDMISVPVGPFNQKTDFLLQQSTLRPFYVSLPKV